VVWSDPSTEGSKTAKIDFYEQKLDTEAGLERLSKHILANLIRLGVEQGMVFAWSRTRTGGWAVAQSPILGAAITVSLMKRAGYSIGGSFYSFNSKIHIIPNTKNLLLK